MSKYVITCTNGFGSAQGFAIRGIGLMIVSDQVWVVRTDESAAWLLKAVKNGVANPGGIFVARLDHNEDIQCEGVHESAERSYGQNPGRRILQATGKPE